MFVRLAMLATILVSVGCAGDRDRNPIVTNQAAQVSDSVLAVRDPTAAGRWRKPGFASAADRGDLVIYPASKVVRHDGAYRWHRADLSERHALNAIADGLMAITTPSGEQLQFRYEKHIEHPSGDWTWVGRLDGGSQSDEVILTFGERAAFGSIAQHGKEALRLTIRDGVSWLVETDAAAVAGIENAATRPRGPDFLIPPKLALAATVSSGRQAVPVTALAADGVATTVVDVVLGYTSGFASSLGGASQAVTRLNNMVAITNEAYVNSQVDARIRLVHAMEVGYPDATSNNTALEELTGFRAPSTRTTPAAAFSALRASRETFGADLVSLVRKFSDPENEGCGVAWLIGGGQSGIDTSDADFGYSVVSDGNDIGSDGKTYFCRQETLAHEFGHNMGSQHDRTAATDNGTLKYGVYPYSFGYNAPAGAGNFYTIMAYGETEQTRYRVFSNPRITFCGDWACGVADQSDNARSLMRTMPIVSTFRATVVVTPQTVVRTDINGDRRSDFLWRHTPNEWLAAWKMDGPALTDVVIKHMSLAFTLVANGDFNGDGKADLMWSDSARNLYMWTSDGSGFTQAYMGAYGEGWQVIGAYDLDGADGRAELVMQHRGLGWGAYWKLNGTSYLSSTIFNIPSSYTLTGFGDFNGDRIGDMAFRDTSQALYAWIGNGTGFTTQPLGGAGPGWSLGGVGDFDGDGMTDVVWRHPGNSWIAVWLLDRGQYRSSTIFHMGNVFQLSAIADYNGDGKSDIVWTEAPTRSLYQWISTGPGFSQNYIGQYGDGWQMLKTNVDPGM